MKVYTHSKYSYVRVAEIPKNEIEKIDFSLCKQPRETLFSFYNRQTVKPAIVTNGGFFNMSNGETCFNYKDENKMINETNSYRWGMGVIGDKELKYGNLSDENWRDFISGYPNLIDSGKKVKFDFALELNYLARRTILGYNNDTVFLVCVETPGFNYIMAQNFMVSLGCTFAINLDGGGSTKMLYNGKSVTKDATNRPVDNVVAIYLKNEDSFTPIDNNNTSNSSIYLKPDKQISVDIGGKNILINQKIIPNGTKATKDICSWIKKGALVKPQRKVNDNTGKPRGITVHNTEAISVNPMTTMAEQYVRATLNENMSGSVVSYYVSGYKDIWQILDTEPGNCEQGWHAGDGSSRRSAHIGSQWSVIGGNVDTISIECIGNSKEAEDATACLVAYLCKKHNLNPKTDVYTHNYFMKKEEKIINDGRKNCPLYILPHWNEFLNTVQKYSGITSNIHDVNNTVNIIYQTYSGNRWLSEVENYNLKDSNGYAGIAKIAVHALKIISPKDSVEYRVHTTNGTWNKWVSSGEASGTIGKPIDAIQIKLTKDMGKTHKVIYRVSNIDGYNYLPWVEGTTDYAGIFGKSIDKIQISIEAK